MTNRDRPLRRGFDITPNQLWTLDLGTPKTNLLLGWLHSHADDYRQRLSLTRIGREFGGGRNSITRCLERLEQAGFVRVEPDERGKSSTVVMLSEAWENLHHDGAPSSATVAQGVPQDGAGGVPQDGAPEKNTSRTTDVEHQGEIVIAGRKPTTEFEEFWDAYPRRQGKATARQRWAKMTEPERVAAMGALWGWCRYYATVSEQFVPHASTWLNQRRWEDDIPAPARPEVGRKTASTRAAIARLRAVPDDLDIFALDSASIREVESGS